MRRRWSVFVIALAGSALLAAGFGVGIELLVARPQPAPQLHTVPAGTLAQAGVTVSAPNQPPYCDVERSTLQHVTSTGAAGCAISVDRARGSLLPVFQPDVQEAVLARVSGPSGSGIGQDRLVWLLVIRSDLLMLPTTYCAPVGPSGPACRSRDVGPTSNRAILIVDATDGQVITTKRVPGPAGGGAPSAAGQ